MNRSTLSLLLALASIACLGLAALPARAAETDGPGASVAVWRLHPLHYLDPREAGFVVEERIPEMLTAEDYDMRHEVLEDRPLQVDGFVLYSRGPEGSSVKQMETSFSARIGETVVVGTSTPRDGRQALVVLMTALE